MRMPRLGRAILAMALRRSKRTAAEALIGVAACLTLSGCAQANADQPEEKREVPAELKAFVLDEAPSDVQRPLYIDFQGKAELVGFALEPAGLAAPGSKLQLKLYWRSTGRLSPGYKLFTHLVVPSGKRFPVEGAGPLRKGALSPSDWEPGKVYVDELELSVPEELDAARFSIVAGIAREPVQVVDAEPEGGAEAKEPAEKPEGKAKLGTFSAVHLRVLSGPSDGRHGGIVATLETGVTPGAKRARTSKTTKRAGAAASGQRRAIAPGMNFGTPPAPGAGRPPSPNPAQ